jgi:DNA modification methylase
VRDNGNKSLVPAQKPVALLEYLVNTYTNAGDTVLDNTMGSGTTGVACKRLRPKEVQQLSADVILEEKLNQRASVRHGIRDELVQASSARG